MKDLCYRFVFTFIISAFVVFLAGCAIGIKSRDHDEIPEDAVYYEESVYDSYYGTSTRSSTYHYYDPNYDPWTMGTYYQHYSGPPHTGGSSGSSSASQIDNQRPAVKGRDSTSVNQSKAPGSGTTSIKRSRSAARRYNKPRSESGRSSVTHRKVRSTSRRSDQKTDESQSSRRRTQTRTSSQKDSSSSKEEEEEDKKTQQD